MTEQRLRLVSGLVLALFVFLHLLNHTLGVFSFEALEAGRHLNAMLWQSPAGTAALYASLLVHLLLGLRSLYRRRTLRMPAWEAAQLALGLAVSLLLAGHLVATRLTRELLDFDLDYAYVVFILWSDPWQQFKQPLLLLAVWTHLCIGMHYWLRLQRWYPHARPVLHAVAVALPVVALLGFVRAGLESAGFPSEPARMNSFFSAGAGVSSGRRELLAALKAWSSWGFVALVLLVFAARGIRRLRGARRGRFLIHHCNGNRYGARVGQSVLETLRAAGVGHASLCGGRARCTTCRIRIGRGLASLPLPGPAEATALARIRAAPNVRLACQVRPRADLDITPLLPADAGVGHPGGVQGREQPVVAMFVDLRDSTSLGEHRLPYDVVFVLNRFFEEMSAALAATGGHYAQFAGDGLLALYGLQGDIEAGCRAALRGAVEMGRRMEALNQRLAGELDAPLCIGIGIHCGDAIVGTMGPPLSPNLSAVGDNINIAARLEQQTRQLECVALVSRIVVQRSGVDPSAFEAHDVVLRGRQQTIQVYAVPDLSAIAPLLCGDAG